MFPSVKDRARQLFGEPAVPETAPPPKIATGRRGAPPKTAAASKTAPEPKTPSKPSRADAKSKKHSPPPVEETPKAIGAWPSPFEQFKSRAAPTAATPLTPSKTATKSAPTKLAKATTSAAKADKSSKEKAEKSSKSSDKKSRPRSPPVAKTAPPPKKAPEPKAVAKKKPESKPAPEPKKLSRPKLQTRTSSRPKFERSSSSSSLDSDDESDEEDDLRNACLKEVSKVTGLKGKNLAISLRQRSSGGWYAALKDVGADKYLKMWMNREKTFATQEEALEAYLIFVKKMNTDMKLFGPMSPKIGKTKGFF